MRIDFATPAHGSRRWVAMFAALVCALPLVGLAAAPAHAAKPSKAGAVWMTHQIPRTGPTVSLRLEWARIRGATSYEVEFAASSGSIARTEVQGSRYKRTLKVRGDRDNVQAVMVNNLLPGRTYCFQLRGRNSSGYGYRGGIHCKVTVRTSRAKPASSIPLVVGTYNTCSSACASSLGPWSGRGPWVRNRILQMNVGRSGRSVDVVAIQEGNEATSYLTSELDGTFTRGCQTGDGTGNRYHDNQSIFVRDDTYDIVPNTADGLNFERYDDPSHGACWVTVREKQSQQEVVVVSVHLWPQSGSVGDIERARQMDLVADTVRSDHPDATIVYAGDFNSTRSREVDAPLKRLYADGQDDAYDQALLYLSRPNRNSATGTTTTPRTSTTWGDHIDRVFAPAGVHMATWEVDYRMDGSKYASPMPSDHNPVLVSLLIPATP